MHSGRSTYTGQKGTAGGDPSGKFQTNCTKPNAKSSAATGKYTSSESKKGDDPTPRQMWRAQPKPLVPLGGTAHELMYGPRKEVRVGGKRMVPPPPPLLADGRSPSSPPVDTFEKDTYARLVFSPLPGTANTATHKGCAGGGGQREEIYVGDAKMDELLSRPSGYSNRRGPAAALASRARGPQMGGLDLGLSGADYNSTLTGTASRRPNAQKPLPLSSAQAASTTGQPAMDSAAHGDLQTDNLNTTIGRTDRAAMLLGLDLKGGEGGPSSEDRPPFPTNTAADRTPSVAAGLREEDGVSSLKGRFTGTGTQNPMFSNASEIENLKALLQAAAAEDDGALQAALSISSPCHPMPSQPPLHPSAVSPKNAVQSNGLPATLNYTNTTKNRVLSPDASTGVTPGGGGGGAAAADAAPPNMYATPRVQAALAKLYADAPAPTAAFPPTKGDGKPSPANANVPNKGAEWHLRTEPITTLLRNDVLTIETMRDRFGESTALMNSPDLFDVISYLSIRSSAVSILQEKEDPNVPPPLDGLRNSTRAQGKGAVAAAATGAAAASRNRAAVASYASFLNTPATVLASIAAASSNVKPSGPQAAPIATATAPSAIFKQSGAAGNYKSGADILRDAVVANTRHLQTFICQKPEEERLHNKVSQWCDRCVLEEDSITEEVTGTVYTMYKEDPDVQHEAAMLEVVRDEEEVRSRELLARRRLDQQSRARRESVAHSVSQSRHLEDNDCSLFNSSYTVHTNQDSFIAVDSRNEGSSVLASTTLAMGPQTNLMMLRHGAAVQPHSKLTSYFNPFDVADDEEHADNNKEEDEKRVAKSSPSPPPLGDRSVAAGTHGNHPTTPLALPKVLPISSGKGTTPVNTASAGAQGSAVREGSGMETGLPLTAAEKYLLELVALSLLPCCPLASLVRSRQQHTPDFLGHSADESAGTKQEESVDLKKPVGACFYLEQPVSFTRDLSVLREINMKLRREEEAAAITAKATASTSGSVGEAGTETVRDPEEEAPGHVLPLRLYFCEEGDRMFHNVSADAVVEVYVDALELLLLLPEQALTALYHHAFNNLSKGSLSRSKKRVNSTYGSSTYHEELLFFSAASAPACCQQAWRHALQAVLQQRRSSASPSSPVSYVLDSFSVDLTAAIAESRRRVAALKKGADVFLRRLKDTTKGALDSQSVSLLSDHMNASSARTPLSSRSPQRSTFSRSISSTSPHPASSAHSFPGKRKSQVLSDWGAETGWEEVLEGGPPMIKHTPVIPGKRELYGCDMQNLYLLATLAAEEVEQVLGPRLQRVREQYHEQLAAMRDRTAAATAADSGGAGASTTSAGKRRMVGFSPTEHASGAVSTAMHHQSTTAGRSNPSIVSSRSDLAAGTAAGETKLLSKALDDWRAVLALYEVEVSYAKGLCALYTNEAKINEYNGNVPSYNAYQERQKKIWGPLYRSGLRISYLVCKFLSVHGLKNLPEDYVYLLHPVALFVGCTGHREMRVKLPEVLLEIVERAKRVRLPVESIPLQEKGEMILQEASEAVAARDGNASDVVSCLATEADVLRLALQFVPVPATRVLTMPSLDTTPSL